LQVDRASRSSRVTISTSPGPSVAIARRSETVGLGPRRLGRIIPARAAPCVIDQPGPR
jgi:hypothetical protein